MPGPEGKGSRRNRPNKGSKHKGSSIRQRSHLLQALAQVGRQGERCREHKRLQPSAAALPLLAAALAALGATGRAWRLLRGCAARALDRADDAGQLCVVALLHHAVGLVYNQEREPPQLRQVRVAFAHEVPQPAGGRDHHLRQGQGREAGWVVGGWVGGRFACGWVGVWVRLHVCVGVWGAGGGGACTEQRPREG
jgi:hypothetical protein